MKAIQITVDEKWLKLLDADPEVRAHGRSAVLRQAAMEYLRKKRRKEISKLYARAYTTRDSELTGWEDEAAWPET